MTMTVTTTRTRIVMTTTGTMTSCTGGCLRFQSHPRAYPYPNPASSSSTSSSSSSSSSPSSSSSRTAAGALRERAAAASHPNCKCQVQVGECERRRRCTRTNMRGIHHINKSVHVIPRIFLILLMSCLGLLPGFVSGLSCYECLSLECYSGGICQSIKESFLETFVRNSHYIHFDPRILCPDPNVPRNSSEWNRVIFNCSRSDSVCLEAPVEVTSSFNGLKDGRRLDRPTYMRSWGFLRGCASRRGLKELPHRTISIRKIPHLDNDTLETETGNYNYNYNYNNDNGQITTSGSGSSRSDSNINTNTNIKNHKLHNTIRYKDGYQIEQIHYHDIYVEHGGANSTKCYIDNCNNRRKVRKVQSRASNSRHVFLINYYHYFIISLGFYATYFHIVL